MKAKHTKSSKMETKEPKQESPKMETKKEMPKDLRLMQTMAKKEKKAMAEKRAMLMKRLGR